MSDEAIFLQTIREQPHDTALLQQYAQWLNDCGDPRGEYIRLQLEMKNLCYRTPEFAQLREQRDKLAQTISTDWLILVGGWVWVTVEEIFDAEIRVRLDHTFGWLRFTDQPCTSLRFVAQPADFKVGDRFEVHLLEIEKETDTLYVVYGSEFPAFWPCVKQFYPVGTQVIGTVINTTTHGVFIELDPEIVGLLSITELARSQANKPLDSLYHRGQSISVVVAELDHVRQRIWLRISPDEGATDT